MSSRSINGRLPNNFLDTIPQSQRALRAIETLKDEYLLDFINVEELGMRDVADIDELKMLLERTNLV